MVLEQFRLDGRVALVTGSSDGLGLGMARALAQAGAVVVLNGRNQDKLDAALAELASEGLQAHSSAADVTDPAQLEGMVEHIEAVIGPIHILVNNAGIQRRGALQDYHHETWRELMSINLDSVFFAAQAVARRMIPRKAGKIINIGSVQCEIGRPGIAPYMASKGAIKMLTKGMAVDWGPLGLNVNAIGPGYFKTALNEKLVQDETFSGWLINRTPSRRWGDIAELGGAVVYLASQASSFCNGHVLYVDGGVTAQL
jgi:gluconate 5-dehydrogenase